MIFALIVAGAALAAAGSDSGQKKPAPDSTAFYTYQYAIPESPAFSFLGTSPSTISRPATPRSFAIGIANGVDSTGQVKQGLAFDVAPWQLFHITPVRLPDYQSAKNPLPRILWNTSVSLGTARVSGDSASTDMALALRTTFFNSADPMADKTETAEYRSALVKCQDSLPTSGDLVSADSTKRAAADSAKKVCDSREIGALEKKWPAKHWNGTSLAAAFASGMRLLASSIDRSRGLGYAGWLTASGGISSWGLLVGQVRFDDREALAKDSVRRQSFTYGSRFVVGSAAVNVFLEVDGVQMISGRASTPASSGKWSSGVEFRAAESLWLATGFGTGFGGGAVNKAIIVADLRWQVASTPRFTAGQ